MNTIEAFLDALKQAPVKNKYLDSTIRTWKSRANRGILSLDFMVEFLKENGYALVQSMQWTSSVEGHQAMLIVPTTEPVEVSETDESDDDKVALSKKLYKIRRDLDKDLLHQWYEWCKTEYSKDHPDKKNGMTEAVFSQMTYGRYISKENVRFALKVLKEGKRLLQEYKDLIRKELDSV